MIVEARGNLFEQQCDALCITTNGALDREGRAIMGKGCAGQAKKLYPGIEVVPGRYIPRYGNIVNQLPHQAQPDSGGVRGTEHRGALPPSRPGRRTSARLDGGIHSGYH